MCEVLKDTQVKASKLGKTHTMKTTDLSTVRPQCSVYMETEIITILHTKTGDVELFVSALGFIMRGLPKKSRLAVSSDKFFTLVCGPLEEDI